MHNNRRQNLQRAGAEEAALTGAVERVTYHDPDSGFCVLRIKAPGSRSELTLIGHTPQVVPGEWLRARGVWIVDRKHGRQFKAETLEMVPPDSPEGIRRFLGSGLIKGIGRFYADKLVDRFGRDVFRVIEQESARLEQVAGIGAVRRRRIKESWNQTRAVRAIMTFLLGHGLSPARAHRIHKTYGDQAIVKVQRDPYCLARDIRGIGFQSADRLAASLGIARDSELRARAGIEHVLLEISQEGHCAFPEEGLRARAAAILEIPAPVITRALDQALTEGRLVREEHPAGALIFLTAYHQAERCLAERLQALMRGDHPCPRIHVERALEWVQQRLRLELAEAQREAVRMAVREKVLILTGGPGVGKTTLVTAILQILSAKGLDLVLCAPTGRAAKRLEETTGREARTIHRLLAFDPARGGFRHDRHHPLKGDVFVVDECSMVDLMLAARLVDALPAHSALLLVGDVDQLPSVGPGSVLKDLMAAEVFPVCRLCHVFRQAAQSDIVANAHRILQGAQPVAGTSPLQDFFMVEEEDPERAVRRLLRLVTEAVPRRFHLDAVEDIQVLAPMRRGSLGSENLNRELQNALNPSGAEVQRFGHLFRAGDKVMQLENNYDRDVYNGDIGRITALDAEERELEVRFDNRTCRYAYDELDELTPAYAMTIHKSQGSEYPCVIVPLHTQHFMMLRRNLLYTAVTRGRRLVVLLGTRKALALALRRCDTHVRITTLREKVRFLSTGRLQ